MSQKVTEELEYKINWPQGPEYAPVNLMWGGPTPDSGCFEVNLMYADTEWPPNTASN
jgi:hypothetical protein